VSGRERERERVVKGWIVARFVRKCVCVCVSVLARFVWKCVCVCVFLCVY